MNIGDEVPDFTATLDDGSQASLTDLLADGPIVLFFYPKAFTGGCTVEACHFRDLGSEFAEVGAQRMGISADDVTTQASFREKHGFDYPLIADTSGEIATIFGTKRIGLLPPRRHTFVIGSDRRLLAAIRSETNMEAHADEALQALRST